MKARISALVAALAVLAGVVAVAPAPSASASQSWIDASSVALTRSDGTTSPALAVGDSVVAKATWSAPAGAVGGDTFSLTLPGYFSAASFAPFALVDSDGNTVGNCRTTDSPTVVICTMTDFINDKLNVHGSLSVILKVSGTTNDTGATINTDDGTTIVAPLPGGGGITGSPAGPAPREPQPTVVGKFYLYSTPDAAVWQVKIPAPATSDQPVTIVDTPDPSSPATAFYTDPKAGIERYPTVYQLCSNDQYIHLGDQSALSVSFASDLTSFTATLQPSAFLPTGSDVGPCSVFFDYGTRFTDGAHSGDVFTNTATVDGGSPVTASFTVQASGSGTGSADQRPVAFTVAKKLIGAAAAAIPADATFPIDYTADGVAKTLTVNASGTPVSSPRYPAGTVFTLTEGTPPPVTNVTWAGADVSVDGTSQGSSASFTPAAGVTSAVVVTNDAEPQVGSFQISKAVTGDGASSVPTDSQYTVDYSYPDAGTTKTGSVVVTNGGPAATVDGVPAGAQVTLSEETPAAVAGSNWGTPSFTSNGSDLGTPAVITITADSTVAVTLTNTATLLPPELGSFQVSKTVAGDGASLVGPGTPFVVDYSYDADGTTKSGTLTVTNGGNPSIVSGLPAGAVVTLTEEAPATVDGASWSTSTFAFNGVPLASPATITIVKDATVSLELTNTLTKNPAKTVSVGDFVWSDTNHDGLQDAGEPGIAGVSLSIAGPDGAPVTGVDGTVVAPVTTDSNGAYSFTNLPALAAGQHYTVTVDASSAALAGHVASPANVGADRARDSSAGSAESQDLTTDGATDDTLDFGFFTPDVAPPVKPASVSVGDFVWSDTNHDGLQDAGEPGIAGVSLSIAGPDGAPVTGVDGTVVAPVTTDSNGAYAFSNLPVLPAGQHYTVTVDAASAAFKGMVASPSDVGGDRSKDSSSGSAESQDLTTDGAVDYSLDFGFIPQQVTPTTPTGPTTPTAPASVSVGDRVWSDSNGNGLQDAGEPGLAGVKLTLTGPNGGPVTDVAGKAVAPVTSSASGAYAFTGLPVLSPGEHYSVAVDSSSATLHGYTPSPAGVGSDRTIDSSTGSAVSSDLTVDGAEDESLDFGFVPPAPPITQPAGPVVPAAVSVGDRVWHDLNADGLQSAGEPGIANVTVTISGPDGRPVTNVAGTTVAPASTDADGLYSFAGLPVLAPGQHYTVTVSAGSAALAGLSPSPADVGSDRDKDSSTGSASSRALTVAGESDDSLDFGFVTSPPAAPEVSPPAASSVVPPLLAFTGANPILAFTGANPSIPIGVGAAILTAGLALVLIAALRRRRGEASREPAVARD